MALLAPKHAKSLIPTVFSDFFENESLFPSKWVNWMTDETIPAVNIKETESDYLVEMAAPGYEKSDFTISVENEMLRIRAHKEDSNDVEPPEEEEQKTDRSAQKEADKHNVHRREFSYRSFARSFRLPKDIVDDGVEARYEQGILSLRIPKKNPAPITAPKTISIA